MEVLIKTEKGKQMIDAREEGKKGVYMASSSAPQIRGPSSAAKICDAEPRATSDARLDLDAVICGAETC